MKLNKEFIDVMFFMLEKGIITSSNASHIADKLIDEIGWDRIEVDESEDGEIVYMLSVIEDADHFKGDFAKLRKIATDPVRKNFNISPASTDSA